MTELCSNQHPMVPPSELLKQWEDDWFEEREHADVLLVNAYAAGALAGADAELEACCKLLELSDSNARDFLYSARRPKPPSLKEQALLAIDTAVADDRLSADIASVVRRALEQIDD